MRLLVIGCGNVGRELMAILARDVSVLPGFRIVAICTRHHGSLVNTGGIEPSGIAPPGPGRPWSEGHADVSDLDASAAADTLDYDVLVELSTLSIRGRGEPALGFVRRALGRGRHVVTANKGPLAFAGSDLLREAAAAGARLLFESTVMDGTPLFSLARSGLSGCRVTAVEGILNATSNLVLDRLAGGSSLEAALAEARAMGIAEADASHDLQGWDSAAKLAVLTNTLMEGRISPEDVDRQGIDSLGPQDFAPARGDGRRWRLVCRASVDGTSVAASVRPVLLDAGHPLAACGGTDCQLTFSTDRMAPFTIRQHAAGLRDTAWGVLSDLRTIAASRQPPAASS